jgi:hypothetical protein
LAQRCGVAVDYQRAGQVQAAPLHDEYCTAQTGTGTGAAVAAAEAALRTGGATATPTTKAVAAAAKTAIAPRAAKTSQEVAWPATTPKTTIAAR